MDELKIPGPRKGRAGSNPALGTSRSPHLCNSPEIEQDIEEDRIVVVGDAAAVSELEADLSGRIKSEPDRGAVVARDLFGADDDALGPAPDQLTEDLLLPARDDGRIV